MVRGGRPLLRENLAETEHPFKNADFQSIFYARSASSVTPGEKSSINTNMKSTTSFPMSLRWTVYVASKQEGGSKMQSGQNLNSYLR